MKRLFTLLLLIISVNVFGQIQPEPSGTLVPLSTNQAYFRASDSTYYFYNGTNYLWNYFLNKQQADKLYQPLGSPVATPFSLSAGYGLSGSSFNGSVARTFTADTASADGLVSKSRLATNLGGYVPSSRTITINGSTRDLTANRIFNVGTVLSVGATAGTGISISGSPITSSGSLTITNTAPDQTVVLNAGTGISTSGTYPNFTITNTLPAVVGIQDSLTKKANRTFDNVASGAIANVKLANSTISGVALGSNLNALTLGNGLTGTSYNGSGSVTATADTTVVQTVSNFFPKGDTRYARTGATGTVTSVGATAGTGISVSGSPITSSGNITVTNTLPDQTVVLNNGTGISNTGTYPNFTVTNTAPDQTVVLNAGTGISTSGTYPNFTITNTSPSSGGTVTSITPAYGLTPQTAITSSGSFGVDTLVLDTVYAKPSDLPTNYWTTNTTQTGLTGDKTTTGNITADSLKVIGGTSTQALMADGSLYALQDSLTKKANRTFDNVASGAIAKAKVDTSATGLQTVSNFFPKGDTRYQRLSVAPTSISATSPIFYNSGTGVISIQVANTSQNGYLSSTDWNTFNGKLDPSGSGTGLTGIVKLAGSQTITGAKTVDLSNGFKTDFYGNTIQVSNSGITQYTVLNNEGINYGNSTYELSVKVPTLTGNRSIQFPNASGTVALTSDIPTYTNFWQRSLTTLSPVTSNDKIFVSSNSGSSIESLNTGVGGLAVYGNSTNGIGGQFQSGSSVDAGLIAKNSSTGPIQYWLNTTSQVATISNTGSFSSTPQGTLYGTASGSITSAQLATSLTDETGTGSAVFSASPTFTGTIIGASSNFSGSMGIGINPTYPLHVSKNLSNAYIAQLANTNTTAGTSFGVLINAGTNSSDRALTVNNADNTVTLLSSLGNGDLEIGGSNATKSSGTAWINPSDLRLKTNIGEYSKGLKEVLAIKPKTWYFNEASGLDKTQKHLSPIAQELQQIMPEMVSTYKGKLNGKSQELLQVDASDMTWLLVKAIQEQQAIIEKLNARITLLENK